LKRRLSLLHRHAGRHRAGKAFRRSLRRGHCGARLVPGEAAILLRPEPVRHGLGAAGGRLVEIPNAPLSR
jgi:hypothetical protein